MLSSLLDYESPFGDINKILKPYKPPEPSKLSRFDGKNLKNAEAKRFRKRQRNLKLLEKQKYSEMMGMTYKELAEMARRGDSLLLKHPNVHSIINEHRSSLLHMLAIKGVPGILSHEKVSIVRSDFSTGGQTPLHCYGFSISNHDRDSDIVKDFLSHPDTEVVLNYLNETPKDIYTQAF